MVNKERRAAQESTVSYEIFEIIMDRLEKEWFELVRHGSLHLVVDD